MEKAAERGRYIVFNPEFNKENAKSENALVEKLYKKIGQLQLANEFLEKNYYEACQGA